MIAKEKIIQTLAKMPDTFSVEDLIEKLLLINKIETGLQQAEAGKLLTYEQTQDKLKKWL